jgi:hypothetical protein
VKREDELQRYTKATGVQVSGVTNWMIAADRQRKLWPQPSLLASQNETDYDDEEDEKSLCRACRLFRGLHLSLDKS